MFADAAKIVVITGGAIAVFGLFMMAYGKSGSSLLISLLLTLSIYIFNKFIR